MAILDPLFRFEKLQDIFADRARVQAMLDFEAALARAEAREDVIPSAAARAIAANCRVELFDLGPLAKAAAASGNLAIPLVKQLTTLVSKDDPEAAKFVHWGATSQDAIDTGSVLQLRRSLDLIAAGLDRFCDALARSAQAHRATPIAGRTWLQQAVPTTLGFKFASWLDPLTRDALRIAAARHRAEVLQFGGAVGTLASLGDRGPAVARALGEELALEVPPMPWHAQRDRPAEVATVLGILTGSLGKIARDVSLLMQTEIAEVSTPTGEGRGGSSTMPQKRNPVASAVVLSAAVRVPGLVSTMLASMVQEHERGLGGWHAEWETLPEIVVLTGGALHHLSAAIEGLEIDARQMAENLEVTRGLIFAEAVSMALASKTGRAKAHELLQAASQRAQKERRSLREVLGENAEIASQFSGEEMDRLFDPRQYQGAAGEFIDRVLAANSSRARVNIVR